MVTVIRPSRARCVNGMIPRHKRAVFTLACWNSRAAIADAPILLLLRASPPARLSLMPSQISARNGATRLAPPHAKDQPDRKRAWLGSKIATGFRRLNRAKVATRTACVRGVPSGFAAYTAGAVDGKSPAALRHVPPGTRTVLGPTVRRPPTLLESPQYSPQSG